MAYFVNKNARFLLEVSRALDKYFGDHALVTYEDGLIKVKILSGFDEEVKRLTTEELEAGIIGGGFKQGINGEEFVLGIVVDLDVV